MRPASSQTWQKRLRTDTVRSFVPAAPLESELNAKLRKTRGKHPGAATSAQLLTPKPPAARRGPKGAMDAAEGPPPDVLTSFSWRRDDI